MPISEIVKTALEANREYLAMKERVNEASALLRQAGLRAAPAIELEAGTGSILGSRGESEYSTAYFHTFETGDKRKKRVAIAQIGIALAEADVQERERQLAFAIKMRFVAAVAERLKLASVSALLPVTRESYQLTVRRVELGDAAPLEQQLLLAEMNRAEAQRHLLTAASDAATVELKALAGWPPERPLDVTTDLSFANRDLTLARLQEHAIRHRPDLHILKLLEEQATAERTLARAESSPDITASARYTRSHARFDQSGLADSGAVVPLRDTDNIVTLGVSIPLFTRDRARPAVAAAESRETQQRLRREHLARAIPQEVEAAYRRWNGALRSLEILRTGVVEPSQGSLTVIREAFRLGELRLFDVLNEQRRLLDLQLSFVDAQAEAARSLVELERAVGGNLP